MADWLCPHTPNICDYAETCAIKLMRSVMILEAAYNVLVEKYRGNQDRKNHRFEEIRQRLAAASPGEWKLRRLPKARLSEGFIQAPRADPRHRYDIEVLGEDDTIYPTRAADLEFIANAKSDITFLLGELEK